MARKKSLAGIEGEMASVVACEVAVQTTGSVLVTINCSIIVITSNTTRADIDI